MLMLFYFLEKHHGRNHETRFVKALTKAMIMLFSQEQLTSCSMKGTSNW